jgi:hypothetical protein
MRGPGAQSDRVTVGQRPRDPADTDGAAGTRQPDRRQYRCQSGANNAQRRPDRYQYRRQSRADNAQRRPARGRPGPDDARDLQTAGDRTVYPLQELRASAAAGSCSGAQPRAAAIAGTDGALTARSGPRGPLCRHLGDERQIAGGRCRLVRMDSAGDRWFVSDDGYGHLEAEMIGGPTTFRRLAKQLAERAGVQFDERCFFVLEVDRDALPGAVIAISNVSKQAVERTAFAVEERRVAISRDVFEQRLVAAFGAGAIAHNISIIGASGKEWDVDVGITSDSRVERLIEFVTPRSSSIAAAVMKFTDIRAAENAPKTGAVLSDRSRTEAPLVSLLSRVVGAAIDAADAPDVYQRAA